MRLMPRFIHTRLAAIRGSRKTAPGAPAAALLPASPFLRTAPGLAPGGAGRRLRRIREWTVTAVAAAAALAGAAVSQRWFDPHGWLRPLYAVHDNLVLPALGVLWTAAFPWGFVYVIPGTAALALLVFGSLSGRRPFAALQRAAILALARRPSGPAVITTVHRLQSGYGVPGRFMRMVIADAAAAAVDAVVFAAPRAAAGALPGADAAEPDLKPDLLAPDPAEPDLPDLAAAWRLVAASGTMTADAGDNARATLSAAATIALLWLVAPPGDPATRLAVRTAWQRLWPAPAGEAGSGGPHDDDGPERVARFLRHALGSLEAAIRDLERPPDHAGSDADSSYPDPSRDGSSYDPSYGSSYQSSYHSSHQSWQRLAELLVTATFLAGLQPGHAGLAMRVIDAVERLAIADLLSGRDGAGAAAEAVAQALATTRAREAAAVIGARIEAAAADALRSWQPRNSRSRHREAQDRDRDLEGAGDRPGPGDLTPALAGLAEAAAAARADGREARQ